LKKFIAFAALLAIAVVSYLWFAPGSSFTALKIVAGSENEALEPLIQDWAAANRTSVTVTYLGSVDISRSLSAGKASEYDAVWPAHSLWIEMGDTQKVVKHTQSIVRSPIVLGLKRPIAEKLGWIGRDDITIQMIEEAARGKEFRLSMTSATQSNSGASAYLGFLYALAGNPDILTMDILEGEQLQDDMRALLSLVDRSSGSSGWLKDSLVANPDVFDAMFNYESLVIEANKDLVGQGRDPLYVIYPANGLAVADSPLGLIDKGDLAKEATFTNLQSFLLSPETQSRLSALGRRTGLIGMSDAGVDQAVWNPNWGIDLDRDIAPIPTPAADVIAEALTLYQQELRKPSLTVWVLDVSGSMEGEPIAQLKTAMGLLLDPNAAAISLLQPSRRDVTILVPFNHMPLEPLIIKGSDPAEMTRALAWVNGLQAGGGTDVYAAIGTAADLLAPYAKDGTLYNYLPAIVAMTDGASDTGNRGWMLQKLRSSGFAMDIPIHSIAFGKADEAQLQELSESSIGRMFTAGDDIAKALRGAKGYN
jgi:Ca-activated chloride channel homolog